METILVILFLLFGTAVVGWYFWRKVSYIIATFREAKAHFSKKNPD